MKDLLAGHKVSEMMTRDCAQIPDDLTLQELVENHILTGGHRCFVVNHGDKAIGLGNPLGNQKGAAVVLAHDKRDTGNDPNRQAHLNASERRGVDDHRKHGAERNQPASCGGAWQAHRGIFA